MNELKEILLETNPEIWDALVRQIRILGFKHLLWLLFWSYWTMGVLVATDKNKDRWNNIHFLVAGVFFIITSVSAGYNLWYMLVYWINPEYYVLLELLP